MMESNEILKKFLFWTITAGTAALLLLNFQYLTKQLEAYFYEPAEELVLTDIGEPNRIIIPSLGLDLPVIYVEQRNEDAFQEGLKMGIVHYPGTAEIGQPGNPYIFGHSSDYPWAGGEYKTALATLPKIEKGELIIATDREGEVFRYEVKETKIINPDETEYLSQYENKKRMLTLQTSYPVGTALKRFIVIAELLSP
jgi:LPXTG-site transpeptidase (sortase) family protein